MFERELYNVVIVGAGPAGLGAAYELAKNGVSEVLVIDKGKDVEQRNNDILSGIGGAGTFSDGKFNFDKKIGWNYNILSDTERTILLKDAEEFCLEYGIDCTNQVRVEQLGKFFEKAKTFGDRLVFAPAEKLVHVGTERLPQFIIRIRDSLKSKGIEFQTETKLDDIEPQGDYTKLYLARNGEPYTITTKKLILALGRAGSRQLSELARKRGIGFRYGPLDIGVRVEVPAEIMKDITDGCYEPKIYITPPTYQDECRTFCVCPNGVVIAEHCEDEGFVGVNGHSYEDPSKKTENTNFALLSRINLTEPQANTKLYGSQMALLASVIGDGKPIIQRFYDWEIGRRSTPERIHESSITPTLYNGDNGYEALRVTPGDISLALVQRVATDIRESLHWLDKYIPGIAFNPRTGEPSKDTLLYCPEAKFYQVRVNVDRNLETNISGVYAVGDGAGLTRGIVPAMITGFVAGRVIVKKVQ